MVSVQYASDLHLDHLSPNKPYWDIITPSAPILVLAGDIASVWSPNYGDFLVWCSINWNYVILVAGNHEFICEPNQAHSRQDTELMLKKLSAVLYNVHYLQAGQAYKIPDTNIVFIGATLYSDIDPEIYDEILVKGDFTRTFIERNNILCRTAPSHLVKTHKRHRQALADAIRSVPRNHKVVVVTHYLPSYRLLEPEFQDDRWRSCYASKDDDLFRTPVKVWVCGHSHRSVTIRANHNILLAMNARGYKEWEVNRKVDIYQPSAVFNL